MLSEMWDIGGSAEAFEARDRPRSAVQRFPENVVKIAFAAALAMLCLALCIPLPLAAHGPGSAPPPGQEEHGDESGLEDEVPTSPTENDEEAPQEEAADADDSTDVDGEEDDEVS